MSHVPQVTGITKTNLVVRLLDTKIINTKLYSISTLSLQFTVCNVLPPASTYTTRCGHKASYRVFLIIMAD